MGEEGKKTEAEEMAEIVSNAVQSAFEKVISGIQEEQKRHTAIVCARPSPKDILLGKCCTLADNIIWCLLVYWYAAWSGIDVPILHVVFGLVMWRMMNGLRPPIIGTGGIMSTIYRNIRFGSQREYVHY